MSDEIDVEPFVLPGEGEKTLVEKARVRIGCEECGEPATQKHGFLLENFRRNPLSSAYGKDDSSWCVDTAIFTCAACRPKIPAGHSPNNSTWSIAPGKLRFAHMFLRWEERPRAAHTPDVALAASVVDESGCLAERDFCTDCEFECPPEVAKAWSIIRSYFLGGKP